ncbi:MAG TPA: metallophosphoesterase family protein [Candidatus Baltobacterales bacterium]|nr:metallophosphoesterase family protein [Candidatus Baltobacterales bacterium]
MTVRVAAPADIHGNLPALEAVLEEVRRESPELVVVCGDVASGPMPAQTIDLLTGLTEVRFVSGNADRGLVEAFDHQEGAGWSGPFGEWCAGQISREDRDFLDSFQATVVVEDVVGLGRVLFCHGSPRSDVEIMTVETPDERIRAFTAGLDVDVVVCGHTHMQFDRTVGRLRVVNPGSVGMPSGEPGAFWAMLGPGVEMRRTEYDREAAATRIRALDWPVAEEFARENVLTVPSMEEAMAFMHEMEAKQSL